MLPAALGAFCLAGLALPAVWRVAVALSLAAIVPALYAAEIFVTLEQCGAAAATGESDRRGKLEVILAQRAAGVDAWPAMRAKAILTLGADRTADAPLNSSIAVEGREFLPLASVPGAWIVACNEAGRWEIYRSDRHGFRNPDAVWDAPTARLALIGDSFVQGDCVADGATIAGLLRPTLGPVLNLGVSGAGPLSKLAALTEYAAPKAPLDVVWFFFEGNDLTKDLAIERRAPQLRSYLEDNRGQGLIDRPAAVSTALRTFLDNHLRTAMAEVDHPQEALLDFLKLYRLRERFGLDPIGLGLVGEELDVHLEIFARVMATAKRRISSWGGRLHVAYLPDSARYFGAAPNGRIRDWIRRETLFALRRADIDTIDIHEVFAAQPDPGALFRYAGSHYNEDGYRAVARAIERHLTQAKTARLE